MQNPNEARQTLEELALEEATLFQVADENGNGCWWCCGGGEDWLASIRSRMEAVYVGFPELRP